MFKGPLVPLALFASLLIPSASAKAQSVTRIEPHGFYGATVTIEAGVRVFRGLPPTSHLIINPTRTPVNVNIYDVPPAPVVVTPPSAGGGGGYIGRGGGLPWPAYGAPQRNKHKYGARYGYRPGLVTRGGIGFGHAAPHKR